MKLPSTNLNLDFLENFLDDGRRPEIARNSVIYSATGNGRIPWISADDIAEVAFRALTDEKSHNTDHVLIGKEMMSYDEVCNAPQTYRSLTLKLKYLSDRLPHV
jgi:uncharacterized protein YbjT (DUF2867 family)